MRLHEGPFDRIASGVKKIEYRLNDEKRREIRIGDTITFYKRPEEMEKIVVKVTDLKHYEDLLSMYTASFDHYLRDMYETPQDAVDDTPYYTDEDVRRYGCLAIHFEKID